MLDINFIREHLDEVKTNCRNRNVQADVDGAVRLDDERKRLVQEAQTLQQQQNELSKMIPLQRQQEVKQEMVQRGRKLREQVTALEAQRKQVEDQRDAVLRT